MDAVLLFSGQGAQKVGMGKDLYDQYPVAKALIEQADKALGESLSAVMFEGPGEELTRTCNCQPALYVHGLACLAVLKELVPSLNPVAAAGPLGSRRFFVGVFMAGFCQIGNIPWNRGNACLRASGPAPARAFSSCRRWEDA